MKKRKTAAVIVVAAALAGNAAIAALMPLAREYGWKQFVLEPMYLLRYVLRPFDQMLLGGAIVEAGRALAEIRIWDRKPEKTRKIVRTVFYVLAGCLTVAAVMTLWLGVEMSYQWYLAEKMRNGEGSFDSSVVPHLIPERLFSGILYFHVMYLDRFGFSGWLWFFLGAVVASCRIEKGETEK